MSGVFAYSLVVSAIILFLYPAVYLTVNKNSSFRFNRALLISTLLISFAWPAMMALNAVIGMLPAVDIATVGEAIIEPITHASPVMQTEVSYIPIILGIYYGGIIVLFLRTTYSIYLLSKLKRSCRKELVDNHALYIHNNGRISPFSFGRAIFISEADRMDAIVRHEMGHINANHWVDILLAEISCIFLWYNPFIWLYKKLIKLNHEYEADNYVINGGINVSDYQHLLIAKALGRRTMPLANSFATRLGSFRHRVLYMSKTKTSATRKLLGTLIIPSLVIAAILINHPISAEVLTTIKNYDSAHKSELSARQQTEVIKAPEMAEQSGTLLPSPIKDPTPLAKIVDYAIEYNLKNDAPIKANIRLTINDKGQILNADIDGEYSPDFKVAINEALSGVKFEPTLDNGKPITIRVNLPVRKL